jgi:hypothetical protein
MPVAHLESGGYSNYYDSNDQTPYSLGNHFNEGDCEGLELVENTNFQGSVSGATALYAVTSGYLSYQEDGGTPRLVVRLPRSLRSLSKHNSGRRFYDVSPGGPNLRHVVYELPGTSGSDVRNAVDSLLSDSNHPIRTATVVDQQTASSGGGGSRTLDSYLSNSGSRTDVLDAFMRTGQNVGSLELLVRAGEQIGMFSGNVTVSFYDSCGNRNPNSGGVQPFAPKGRPLNPAYFLYVMLTPSNAGGSNPSVTPKTALSTASGAPRIDHHPIQTLLESISDTDYEFMELNLGASHPPEPRHVTLDRNGETGIRIGSLAEWHQSRNGTNPYHPGTPYACSEWRVRPPQPNANVVVGKLDARGVDSPEYNQGSMTDDEVDHAGDTIAFANEISDVPHVNSLSTITNQVTGYWNDYGPLFNAVADAFQVPCELLLALAAKETGSQPDADRTQATRLEPLDGRPPGVSATVTNQLNNYAAIDNAAYTFPIPWNDGTQITGGADLTWGELATLTADHPEHVKISPGMMQTLVDTADSDLAEILELYGSTHLTNIQATVSTSGGSVTLSVDNPPSDAASLFADWLAVTKDASGADPEVGNSSNPVDTEVSKLQQAFHQLTAGAAHVKHMYNHSNGSNVLTDYDPPTVASGYNDGALAYSSDPSPGANLVKYHRRFGLLFYRSYPAHFPLYYNQAVEHFSGSPSPTPSVRLWGEQ